MKKFDSVFVYLPFALLFGLIPYRILGVFHLDYFFRLVIGFLFFLFFVFQMENLVVRILNTPIIQLLFFYLLTFENFIYNMNPSFLRYLFVFSFFFNVGAWPNQTEDPLFWYILMIFFLTFYRQMRAIFLNPEFDGSFYSSQTLRNEEDLNWKIIVVNMSSICLLFFGKPIQNQLGPTLSQKSFGNLSKRYVFTSPLFRAMKTHPELALTAVGSFGAVFGFSVSEYGNYTRHSELAELQKQANLIQERLANESKRANDLKERELLLQLPKPEKNVRDISDSSFICSKEEFFFF